MVRPMHVRLTLLFTFILRCGSSVPCTTIQDCKYQGCIQPALEGNFFGCNCATDQIENSADGSLDTRCYPGDDDEVFLPSQCVYSVDYGLSFQYCPCQTSCSEGQYLDGCHCQPCPPGHFCVHSHAKICTQCASNEYQVRACTEGSDTICRPCTQCGEGEYQLRPCTSHRDGRCVSCQYCTVNYYAAAPCTNETNTECAPCKGGNWCPGNQIMYEPIGPGSKIYRDPNSL